MWSLPSSSLLPRHSTVLRFSVLAALRPFVHIHVKQDAQLRFIHPRNAAGSNRSERKSRDRPFSQNDLSAGLYTRPWRACCRNSQLCFPVRTFLEASMESGQPIELVPADVPPPPRKFAL
jgi:hypothetical protein